jgi:hypothetical protein
MERARRVKEANLSLLRMYRFTGVASAISPRKETLLGRNGGNRGHRGDGGPPVELPRLRLPHASRFSTRGYHGIRRNAFFSPPPYTSVTTSKTGPIRTRSSHFEILMPFTISHTHVANSPMKAGSTMAGNILFASEGKSS